jgi:CheY-like chemotaxis protein
MKTALIIEDNEDNMTLVVRLLKKAGWATLWAETGEKGLKMLADCKPDFVVLDIQLPDIDGTEVLKKMRSSEEGKEVPIIVVTSYAMAGDREKFLAAGCNAYLEKPINPGLFITQIRSVVGE